MTIRSRGYLGVGTPDPEAWADFAGDVIGMSVLEPGGSETEPGYLLRMDDHPFRFWVDVRGARSAAAKLARAGRQERGNAFPIDAHV